MTALAYRPARELLGALGRGDLTSVAILEELAGRVRDLNPSINAVATLAVEAALEQARTADDERRGGHLRGPLHGLPMTIKDCFEVAGMPTTCGVESLRSHVPLRHASVVQRLADAGAIIFGKTNVPPYSLDLQTFNAVFGVTRNPRDLARTPGGSSGGAAAALSAGMTPVELGTDLAGSLRIPAHWCGVAALKPGYGRLPLDGVLAGPPGRRRTPDLVVAGPMARTVDDLALLWDVLSGAAGEAGGQAGRPLRIAAWTDEGICPVDADTSAVLAGVTGALRAAGHAVSESARPAIAPADAFRLFLQLMYGEMSAGFPEPVYRALRAGARSLADDAWTPLTMMASGAAQSHRDWLAAVERREELRSAWQEFFTGFDALLTPVAPFPAPLHDHRPFEERTVTLAGREFPYMQQSFWVGLATAALLPAAVVPAGVTAAGLPVGVQLIGAWQGERALLDVARVIERLTGGFRSPDACP